MLLFISLPRVYKLGTIDLKRELKALAPRREKHRPKAARGGRHVQPDDGVTEERWTTATERSRTWSSCDALAPHDAV